MSRKGSDRKEILARLIEARDPDTGEPLEEAELQTEAWSNIVAGSDTTATSLTSIMFRVMKNPRIYDRLVTEIRTAFPPHSNEIPLTLRRIGYRICKHVSKRPCEFFLLSDVPYPVSFLRKARRQPERRSLKASLLVSLPGQCIEIKRYGVRMPTFSALKDGWKEMPRNTIVISCL